MSNLAFAQQVVNTWLEEGGKPRSEPRPQPHPIDTSGRRRTLKLLGISLMMTVRLRRLDRWHGNKYWRDLEGCQSMSQVYCRVSTIRDCQKKKHHLMVAQRYREQYLDRGSRDECGLLAMGILGSNRVVDDSSRVVSHLDRNWSRRSFACRIVFCRCLTV